MADISDFRQSAAGKARRKDGKMGWEHGSAPHALHGWEGDGFLGSWEEGIDLMHGV